MQGTDPIPPDDGDPPKDNPSTPFWNEEFGTWTNPPRDVYGHQQATGWTSQTAYQDYVSTINNYQTSTQFFENVSGNPCIPLTSVIHYAQNPRVAQKQKNCKTVFDAKMDVAQGAAQAKVAVAIPLCTEAKIKSLQERWSRCH